MNLRQSAKSAVKSFCLKFSGYLESFVVQNGGPWRCHFFVENDFSGFLLGNRQKKWGSTTYGAIISPAKMPPYDITRKRQK